MSSTHFVLTPVGSAGDVHPYLAMGRELRRRGHEVTLLAAEPFGSSAKPLGLKFVPTVSQNGFEAVSRHPDLWHPTRGLRLILRLISQSLPETYAALTTVYEPERTVLVGHTLSFATRVFEEEYGAPAATVHLAPAAFRSDHWGPVIAPCRNTTPAPRWFRRALWWLGDRMATDPHITPALNALRRQLGLTSVRRVFRSWIHSPQRTIGIFPDWFGSPEQDWPPHVELTGFFFFDDPNARPADTELEQFLSAGDPPIAFTPGSANRQAPRFFKAALSASATLGCRALLLTQYPEQLPTDLPAHVRHVSYAPFSQLLPRCAAIVHHGGIGTSAQGLAAGIPQLVMPMGFDQPDNAARLERLGVGAWLAPRRFTGRQVTETLGRLLESEATTAACRDYRLRTREGDALAWTCDLLEEAASGS